MRQKLLHELLNEDQEPFFLSMYIKNQTQLQLKKPKPVSQTPSRFVGNFRKKSCFFGLSDSPNPKKSPICFSIGQSPKSPNNIFLHVPAKTAALLLEAALKIQRNSAAKRSSTKPPLFGLFGSLIKRLTHISNKTKKRSANTESIGDCACRRSSGDNVSTRGIYGDHDSDDAVGAEIDEIDLIINGQYDFSHDSPFRFVLQRSPPTSGSQTPDLPSPPATSPAFHNFEIGSETDSLKKLTVEVEEEEEKEQNSPVCVLDPPFKDDDDDEAAHEREGDKTDDDGFDYECSFAIVQRAKQQLLKKLYRFEKLAELDPIELEKRMLEEQDSDEEDGSYESDHEDYYFKEHDDVSVTKVLESSFHHPNKVPDGMKKLVADLVAEEERKQRCIKNRDMVARGVCRRLETWKEVDLDTIDMMVEQDMGRDAAGWVKRDQEMVGEAAVEIEVAIFGLMVEELFSEELVVAAALGSN